MKELFFPKITRATIYRTKACGAYYGYATYKEDIHRDCQNRCVYCDVKIEESGYEGFALDHFRPQELFPGLKDVPTNLVIACGKCNRSKSSHWPVGKDTENTHDGVIGFLDPFECDRHEYFQLGSAGDLAPLQGPSTYLIELLGLNRPSRVVVRRHRMLNARIGALITLADESIKFAVSLLEEGHDSQRALEILKVAKSAIESVRRVCDEISSH